MDPRAWEEVSPFPGDARRKGSGNEVRAGVTECEGSAENAAYERL